MKNQQENEANIISEPVELTEIPSTESKNSDDSKISKHSNPDLNIDINIPQNGDSSNVSPVLSEPMKSPSWISVGGESIPLSFNTYSSNFEELECIGAGGFSKVFLAKRIIDESVYAVKKIPITKKINTATTIGEVRLMAKLHHSNIVRYYQAWYEAIEKGSFVLDNGDEADDEDSEEEEEDIDESTTDNSLEQPLQYKNSIASTLTFDSDTTDSDSYDDNHTKGVIFSEMTNTNTNLKLYPSHSRTRTSDNGILFEDSSNCDEDSKNSENFKFQSFSKSNNNNTLTNTKSNSNPNPNPMQLSDDWEYVLFIQMEYCEQKTLKEKLLKPPPDVSEKEILEIIIQISKALIYIHKSGMIHRDVKPENIFFHNDDNVRLGDFGISRIDEKCNKKCNDDMIGEEFTSGLGSILYVSPEQLSSSHYDYRTDIFSLGMVFFEMFVQPFSTTMEKFLVFKQAKNGIFPKYYENRMSRGTFELIRSMIKKDPNERPELQTIINKCEEIKGI